MPAATHPTCRSSLRPLARLAAYAGAWLLLGLATPSAGLSQCAGGKCWTPAGPPAFAPSAAPAAPAGVVRVVVQTAGGTNYGTGSLVSVRPPAAYVLTCHHLFDEQTAAVEVRAAGRRYQARVVASDAANDLTLLLVADPGMAPLSISPEAPSGLLTTGGFGGEGRYRTIRGPILGYATPVGATAPSLKLQGAVRSGDSGGPVLDAAGRLVGVVWGVRDGVSYAAFGEPIRQLLDRLSPAADPGLVRVRPRRPATPASPPEQQEQKQRDDQNRRLADLERRVADLKPCDCDGRFARRDELAPLARRSELESARADADERHAGLLDRIRESGQQAVQDAKRSALSVVSERLAEHRPSLRALTTVQVVAGGLSLGGPVGLALLGAGLLGRRRLKKRSTSRGRGGPRRKPFRRTGTNA